MSACPSRSGAVPVRLGQLEELGGSRRGIEDRWSTGRSAVRVPMPHRDGREHSGARDFFQKMVV